MDHWTKFEIWMDKVNAHLVAAIGLASDDLPDCCYADWYEDDFTPSEAAREALASIY